MAVDLSLDARGVDRIIQAVGKGYEPANLDRSALRRAIDESAKSAEIISAYRQGTPLRYQIKRLKQIRKTAQQLASSLEVKDVTTDMIQQGLGEPPLAMISRLIIALEVIEHVLGDLKPSKWGNPTANEWFAGVELPCVFEEHFYRKTGRSRNKDGKADGPCVRFIATTMLELGTQYSSESITRVMTRLRPLRDRRRLLRQSNAT
jgi:hypothetical protein